MNHCLNCHAEIPDHDRYCGECLRIRQKADCLVDRWGQLYHGPVDDHDVEEHPRWLPEESVAEDIRKLLPRISSLLHERDGDRALAVIRAYEALQQAIQELEGAA